MNTQVRGTEPEIGVNCVKRHLNAISVTSRNRHGNLHNASLRGTRQLFARNSRRVLRVDSCGAGSVLIKVVKKTQHSTQFEVGRPA